MELAQNDSLKMRDLRLVFGDLMERSAYDQYEQFEYDSAKYPSIWATSPSCSRSYVLTIKHIAFGPGLETGAFSFELPASVVFKSATRRNRGRVDLEVFDSAGHHIEILCSTTNDGVRFSQSELNRILTSVHTPAAPTRSPASQNWTGHVTR